MLSQKPDGSQIVNVSLKLEDGSFGAVEVLTMMSDGVFYRSNKRIGKFDSPEFQEYIKKFIPQEEVQIARPPLQNEDELFKRVGEVYVQTKSIKKTAKWAGMSEERTRRILFTIGAYTCDTHEKIMSLSKEGVSLSDAAKQVGLSVPQVRAYLP